MRVREQLPLRTPVAEDGDIVLSLCNSSSSKRIGDPVIAAAAGASALAETDPHKLCFCYCDSPDMELVSSNAANKQFINSVYLLIFASTVSVYTVMPLLTWLEH